MKKQVLLLSVAVTALATSGAFADPTPDYTDITTAITVPVATATAMSGDPDGTPADILLDTGGSITLTLDGAAVTINSNNAFDAVTGTTISNKNTTGAMGILVDMTLNGWDSTLCATSNPCFKGITDAGIMDLSGTGDTKKGLWLEGPLTTSGLPASTFVGDIDMTGSTMTITGDNSIGVQIDSLADLNGNLTLGAMNLKPTSTASTAGVVGLDLEGILNGDLTQTAGITLTGSASSSAGALVGMDINGTINGNVTVNKGTALTVIGSGAQGMVLRGNIDACDQTITPGCTSIGTLRNSGTISTLGLAGTATEKTGNPVASEALGIGGSVAGGIYNDGASFTGDAVLQASIQAQSEAPAIYITPSLQNTATPVPIVIGVDTDETIDPGFSLYNRGVVTAVSLNYNESSQAVFIGSGTSTATVTLDGGIFNSGTIQAVSINQAGGIPVTAIGLNIGAYASIGPNEFYTFSAGNGIDGFVLNPLSTKLNIDDLHDEQGALVNSSEVGGGSIIATVSGTLGGEADAIVISANSTLPSIINSGRISAIATSTDSSISSLSARAIVDRSGTLNFIQNNGLIAAAASTLDNASQIARAIDLSADTASPNGGVLILNQATVDTSATINGDIVFGTGDNQIIDVVGASTTNVSAINGNIFYGGGSTAGSDQLIIRNFATVTGKVTANPLVGVDVDVQSGGTFNLRNDTTALNAYDFSVDPGGTLNLTLLESFRTGIVTAINDVTFASGAKLNLTYGSFVPDDSTFILMTAPQNQLLVADTDLYNQQIANTLPFLFKSANLHVIDVAGTDELVLDVAVKDAADLGLTGYAAQMLPFANQALSNDDVLGAAFVAGITNQKTAQLAYNQLAPDVSGGARAIAIALTDQSSGPVAARQRILRMYGKESGEVTLWGEEFAEFVNDPGDKSTGQTGFKDHGFGFVLGLDGGDPKTGWYGGAFSFYSGDIIEPLPRDSHTNTLWYMLTGYTDWRGRGLFLDTKVDVGYMNLKSKRFVDLTIPATSGTGSTSFIDEADSKRPGLVGAAGFTTGAILAYGSTTFTPQLSVDGMTMREEGYTETHPGTSTTGNGKGMDLQTQSFYASSLRAFIGTEVRQDLNFGDFFVQPDLRIGYRYDFLNDPTKLKVNFADIGTNSTPTPGPVFTLIGPDPAQGNFVAGASIAATTDAWTLGVNFDFVRGTNGATTESGTVHLLGRI